ncbi:MAG: helix-turn-helix transcriptional regulator [Clostridia bacterium]|jgi:transcriptional regulator with XRE-family HTH domain|nr:helix-turn-helix transcriptional regulator [Clostridia bacterium]
MVVNINKKMLEYSSNIYNIIRRNIKKYRKEKNITSAELASRVNLSHAFIRQIESEKVAYNFSVETLYKISVALDVKLDDLIKN